MSPTLECLCFSHQGVEGIPSPKTEVTLPNPGDKAHPHASPIHTQPAQGILGNVTPLYSAIFKYQKYQVIICISAVPGEL